MPAEPVIASPPTTAPAPGLDGLPAAPPSYDADVDEMTGMGLAVLATVRERLLARAAAGPVTLHTVLSQLDSFAAELAARHDDDDGDDDEDGTGDADTGGGTSRWAT